MSGTGCTSTVKQIRNPGAVQHPSELFQDFVRSLGMSGKEGTAQDMAFLLPVRVVLSRERSVSLGGICELLEKQDCFKRGSGI